MKAIDDAVDQEEESRAPFFARAIRFIPAQLKIVDNGREKGPVDPDAYNGDMPAERGESRPQPENDSTNLYEQAIEGLPLNGTRPELIVLDQDGRRYLRVEDTAAVADVTTGRVKTLISKGRLLARKLNGRANVVDVLSLFEYIDHGRKKTGRPRKNPS